MTMLARRFRQLPIRGKLLAMVLVPLALVLPLLGLILLAWGNVAFDRLLITKVQSDLAVAQGYFERVLVEVGASAGAVADSHALHRALEARPRGDLVQLLRQFKQREALDFINLRAPDGSLLVTDTGPADRSDPRSPAFRHAAAGRSRAGLEVLQPGEVEVFRRDHSCDSVSRLQGIDFHSGAPDEVANSIGNLGSAKINRIHTLRMDEIKRPIQLEQ